MTSRRTYWHLEGQRRRPSPYDIGTSRLLYYPDKGFAVHGAAEDWYRRHQQGSALQCASLAAFRDPRETTYAAYVERQREREAFVDGVLRAADDGEHDRALAPVWLDVLARVLAPLRYPGHGLQMVAAYVAQMAPEGRVVVAAMMQAGDEMRRVQRLAYRLRQLQLVHEALGDDGRARWENDPAWQPLREVIERLLVAYDWGEAFVALCLVVKPGFDALVAGLGREARDRGDQVLHGVCFSLGEDAVWHREWAGALTRVLCADRAENRGLLVGWIERWWPRTRAAVAALAPAIVGRDTAARDVFVADVERACRAMWLSLELEVA